MPKCRTEPFCKEQVTPPEVIAAFNDETRVYPLPSLCDHRIDVVHITSRGAPSFYSLRDVPAQAVLSVFYSTHQPREGKDGVALVPGDAKDYRTAACLHSASAFPFDFDGTVSLSFVEAALRAADVTCVLHTTYSHRADFAKVRAIAFPKEKIPIQGEGGIGLDGYKALYDATALKFFGTDALSLIDLSCRTPAQPIYVPAKPIGTDVQHNIIPIDGKLLDWRVVWSQVEADVAERRARIAERRAAYADAPHNEKIRDMRACLEHIPADDYGVWFKVLAIIHNETDGSGEGLALGHDWSSSAPEKYDPDAVDEKWDQLDRNSYSGQRAGVGTLIYLAQKASPRFTLKSQRAGLARNYNKAW